MRVAYVSYRQRQSKIKVDPMKKLEDIPRVFLVPCFAFRNQPSAWNYHSVLKDTELYPFLTFRNAYVPRFSAGTFDLGWLENKRSNYEEKLSLRKLGEEFPPDQKGKAYHCCLLMEGPGKIQPRDWQEKSPVNCFAAWTWTDGSRDFGDITLGALAKRKLFAARLGLGLVYSEPQRPMSQRVGKTFDLLQVEFQTRDALTRHYGDDELFIRVLDHLHGMRLPDLKGMPTTQRALFDRAQREYMKSFPSS